MNSRTTLIALAVIGFFIALAMGWIAFGGSGSTPSANASVVEASSPRGQRSSHEPVPARAEVAVSQEKVALTIRVIDADGEPVPAAIVRYRCSYDTAEIETEAAQRLWERDREAWLIQFGTAATTHEDGSVSVPVAAVPDTKNPWLYACARHADQFAEGWLDSRKAEDAELVLHLVGDLAFVAKLVDAHDAVVPGIALAAHFTAVSKDYGAMRRRRRLGITDDGGLLSIAHVQTWRDSVQLSEGAHRVRIGPDLPGCEDAKTELNIDCLRSGPVIVRMPPTGRIVVIHDGWRERAGGSERWRPKVDLRPIRADLAARAVQSFDAEIDTLGRAEFEWVALGQTWDLRLNATAKKVRVKGPRTAGEEIVVHVAAPAIPLFVGRLLHAGQAVKETSFQLSARADGKRDLILSGKTDSDGRFLIEPVAAFSVYVGTVLTELRVVVTRDGDEGSLIGEGALTSPVVLGQNLVGDLAVVVVEPVLTGKVIGDVDKGQTHLRVQEATAGNAFRLTRELRLDLRPDGSFIVRGVTPAGALRLVVFSQDHIPTTPIPFVAGQRDLEVVLERGGQVEVSVITGSQVSFITLTARLVPNDGRARKALFDGVLPGDSELETQGSDRAMPNARTLIEDDPWTLGYGWSGLPSGRYRLQLFAWGSTRPVAEIADVRVENGRATKLDVIDLEDHVRYLRLRFKDLDKSNMTARDSGFRSRGFVFVQEGGELTDRCLSIDGPVSFLAAPVPLDLVVEVYGFRRKILRDVHSNVDVVLEPGYLIELEVKMETLPDDAMLEVRVTAAGGAALPAGKYVMSPAAGGSFGKYYAEPMRCKSDGTSYRVRASALGNYSIDARLRYSTGRIESCLVMPSSVLVTAEGAQAKIIVSR